MVRNLKKRVSKKVISKRAKAAKKSVKSGVKKRLIKSSPAKNLRAKALVKKNVRKKISNIKRSKSVKRNVRAKPKVVVKRPAKKPKKELCYAYSGIQSVENDIRDLINWVAIFEGEYGLSRDVVLTLRSKLEQLAKKIGKSQIFR